MRCDAMRCDAMRCDAMRCDAMRCDAMRCDAIDKLATASQDGRVLLWDLPGRTLLHSLDGHARST
jgi:hypothetical protein